MGRFKVTEMQLIQGFELLVLEFKEVVTDFERLFTIPKKKPEERAQKVAVLCVMDVQYITACI